MRADADLIIRTYLVQSQNDPDMERLTEDDINRVVARIHGRSTETEEEWISVASEELRAFERTLSARYWKAAE